MEKICAPRASKKHPHVWSKDELVARATAELGMTATKARQTLKAELCRLLGISVVGGAEVVPAPKSPKTTGSCIERSGNALKDHQKAVARYMDTHRGLIVFHKVGSGKTLTAIAVSQCYLDRHPTHRVVVIAPAGLIHNFRDEMKKSYVHLKHPERYEFYSYQKFTSLVKSRKTPVCHNALVIIDEGHNLRTPFKDSVDPKKRKGVNTKNVLACADKANKVLILTGTPLYNSRNDIFTLFNMIRDKGTPPITGDAYKAKKDDAGVGDAAFKRLHCKISYHDTSGDPNFPRRIDHEHFIVMSPEYKAKYLEVLEKVKNMDIPSAFVSHLFGEKNLAVFFNALRRAVNNLDNTAANRKLQWLVDTLRSFPAKEKTIVFSNFLDAGLRLVAAKLPSTISYAVIEGKVSMDERKKIVDDFNKGKYRVLFLSRAGGEGLDMKGVRHVILMDPTWNEATNEQVIGRAIRFRSHADFPKEERNVVVHRLLHILPEDVPVVKEMDDYFSKKGDKDKEEPRLSPEDNSIDLFLTYFLRKKQVELDKYNAMLQSYSIEKNACP